MTQKAAAVTVAQTNLNYTVIRSPIDGTVVARNVDVGQTVAASLQAPTIFTIAQDLKKMWVYAKTDESDVGNIKVGKPVSFKVDAFPKDIFHGVVSQVRMNATMVQSVVTYDTIIEFANPDLKLFPGMTAYVTIPVDTVQKNAVILFGDVTKVLGPFGTYARDILHAKTAALVYPNIAGITDGAAAIAKGLTDAGVKVKKVGYSQGQTDLIGPLTAAGAQTADMVIPYSDASGCVNQAKGLKQLGITDAKKIVSAPLCLNPTVSAGLGGDYPIWTYAIASSLFGDPTDPGMPPYMKVAQQYGVKTAPDPWVIVSFSDVLTTVKFLNELGPDKLTTQAIIDKAHSFTGPVALGAPSLQCGKYSDAPAVCNDRAQFFTYSGKNNFKKAAAWLQPPQ